MEKGIDFDDVRKYFSGLAAANYVTEAVDEKGRADMSKVKGAKACLDALTKKLDSDGKAFVSSMIGADSKPYDMKAHAQDIISASQTAASIFVDKVKKFRPIDFAELFNESFDHYFEDKAQKEAAKKFLEGTGEDSYSKIQEAMARAKPYLEKPELYKEDEVKSAKKKYEKYKPVIQLVEKLQEYALRKITGKIDDKNDKQEALDLVGYKPEKKN